jgi:quercetin dioxygenase-like cupin family protein
MIAKIAAALLATAAGLAPLALATAQPVQKTTLQEQPFPGPIDHTVMVRTVVARGAQVAPHTHPGVEMAYVAGGKAVVSIAGRPDLEVSAGGSFSVPNQVVHSVRNTGEGELTMVSTYVVDRRKPIASPAPRPR